jgi:DNA repair photolyase
MKRFSGHQEPWGSFVDVKINAAERLEQILRKKRKWGFSVLLSSVTDAYQPLEKSYKITRSILKILHQYRNFTLDILTRSSLILRDLDLLSAMNQKGIKITIGMSISLIEDEWRKLVEPRSSSIDQRISSLEKIHEAGVTTYLFFGPFIPGISSFDVLDRVDGIVDSVLFDRLNPRGGIDQKLFILFQKHGKIPKEYERWFKADKHDRNDYLDELAVKFRTKIDRLGIKDYQIVFKDDWGKNRPI